MPNAVGQYPGPKMDSVASKPVGTTTVVKTPNDITVPPPANKEEGSSSLMKALTGLAIVGSAAVLLYNLRNSKNMLKTVKDFKAQGGKFEKGIAKNADGSLFEGILVQKGKNGDTYTRTYANGRLINASKNFAEARNVKTDKIENFVKEYSYTQDNKLSSIKTKIYENGKVKTETTTTPTNMLALGKFKKVGDKTAVKIVDGKAVTKDGKNFDGVIAEKLGDDILISEYKDGEKISERLNMTLKDNKYKKGAESYSLNKTDLQKREEEILRARKEKAEMQELQELEEAIAKEEEAKKQVIAGIVEGLKEKKTQDAKTSTKIKNFFTSIFSSKKP